MLPCFKLVHGVTLSMPATGACIAEASQTKSIINIQQSGLENNGDETVSDDLDDANDAVKFRAALLRSSAPSRSVRSV